MSGDGSIATPWDLQTALYQSSLGAGNTLYLRGGTYKGDFKIYTAQGSAAGQLTIQPYQNEKVVIDGTLDFYTPYVTVRDLEIYRGDWTKRETMDTGPAPPDLPYPTRAGVVNEPTAHHCKVINCVIHDVPLGVLLNESAGWELNGNIIFDFGWYAPTWGRGHAIYAGNPSDTPFLIRRNILFDGFGYNLHGYAEGAGGGLRYMTYAENIAFHGGILGGVAQGNLLCGGGVVAVSPIWRNNRTWHGKLTTTNNIGWVAGATDATLEGNYLPEGLTKAKTTILSETGNTYTKPAAGLEIFVTPNDYDASRGHIAIYNWDHADTVTVDVSKILAAGDAYTLRNVQDYWMDIATGTVVGDGTIKVDMRAIAHTVRAPQGWSAPATTFPEFGAWLLEKA